MMFLFVYGASAMVGGMLLTGAAAANEDKKIPIAAGPIVMGLGLCGIVGGILVKFSDKLKACKNKKKNNKLNNELDSDDEAMPNVVVKMTNKPTLDENTIDITDGGDRCKRIREHENFASLQNTFTAGAYNNGPWQINVEPNSVKNNNTVCPAVPFAGITIIEPPVIQL